MSRQLNNAIARPHIKRLTVAGERNGFDTNRRNNVVVDVGVVVVVVVIVGEKTKTAFKPEKLML